MVCRVNRWAGGGGAGCCTWAPTKEAEEGSEVDQPPAPRPGRLMFKGGWEGPAILMPYKLTELLKVPVPVLS